MTSLLSQCSIRQKSTLGIISMDAISKENVFYGISSTKTSTWVNECGQYGLQLCFSKIPNLSRSERPVQWFTQLKQLRKKKKKKQEMVFICYVLLAETRNYVCRKLSVVYRETNIECIITMFGQCYKVLNNNPRNFEPVSLNLFVTNFNRVYCRCFAGKIWHTTALTRMVLKGGLF